MGIAQRAVRGQSDARDGEEFLKLAPQVPVRAQVQTYPLREANQALWDLRSGRVSGAAVLVNDTSSTTANS